MVKHCYANIREYLIFYVLMIHKFLTMECDDHQQIINEYIEKYEQSDNKANNLWKKANMHLDDYQIYLQDNYGAKSRFDWLASSRERLNQIKQQKNLVVDKVEVQDILNFGRDIDQKLDSLHKNTHEAIKISTYIRVELDHQIEELDGLYVQNKDLGKRVKRAQKGLRVIIRRAMLNRCTRFLCVITVLGVIATIIVYILKDNNVIKGVNLRTLQ